MVSSTQTKIEKVEEAIQGWQSIINYTDTTLAQAEAGELEALTKLMPHELMAAAKNLDLSDAPGAAAEMELYDAISFTGGGHAVGRVRLVCHVHPVLTPFHNAVRVLGNQPHVRHRDNRLA